MHSVVVKSCVSANPFASLLLLQVLFLLILTSPAWCTFTPAFRAFLRERGGATSDEQLSRTDLGPGGSFGGGNNPPGQWTT